MHTPGAFRALLKEAPIPQYKSACENYYLILECHRNEALYPTIPPACLAKALPTNLPWPFILAPSTPLGHTRRPCQSQFLSPRILLTTALRGGCHNPPRQTQAAAMFERHVCLALWSRLCPLSHATNKMPNSRQRRRDPRLVPRRRQWANGGPAEAGSHAAAGGCVQGLRSALCLRCPALLMSCSGWTPHGA